MVAVCDVSAQTIDVAIRAGVELYEARHTSTRGVVRADMAGMARFVYVAPERLQFREGGGVLAVFGVPFFLAGIFLLLTAGGALPMGGDGDLAGWGRPMLGLMGLVFTGVGGTLVFGRAWITLDVAERAATKSWGLLVPFNGQARPRSIWRSRSRTPRATMRWRSTPPTPIVRCSSAVRARLTSPGPPLRPPVAARCITRRLACAS